MNGTTVLNYDGTFNGLLTAIFISYEERLEVIAINPPHIQDSDLFSETLAVITDNGKANRVWKAFSEFTSTPEANSVFYAFLSEELGIELEILKYFQLTFEHRKSVAGNFTNSHVLKIERIAKKVEREKHRMEAFVRFKLTRDNIYFATIEPDFNILPIIKNHFTSRYSDQQWVIYDMKRKFGLYYDQKETYSLLIDFTPNLSVSAENDTLFELSEINFQKLWSNYFEATTIKSRINTRLHHQHVPKRYWKYLIEKNPLHN